MTIGSYTVHEEIGSGTFGIVQRAEDKRTGEIVAIKCISKTKIQRNRMGTQVKKEITTMKQLKHPNIIQIKEVLMSKHQLYLVMDYVDGGELYGKLALNGKMSETMARKYFRQLMSGIAFCHSKHICHRDIKPENILLDSNGDVKIADFGFASIMEIENYTGPAMAVIDESEASVYDTSSKDEFSIDSIAEEPESFELNSGAMKKLSTMCGTSHYMAPDVHGRTKYHGDKADIWSCGVVLYYLLAGYLPFDDNDNESVVDQICAAKYNIPVWFSDAAVDLISNILILDADKRLSAKQIMKHPWMLIRGDERTPVVNTRRPSILVQKVITPVTDIQLVFENDCNLEMSIIGVNSCLKNLKWTHVPLTKETRVGKASKVGGSSHAMIEVSLSEVGTKTKISIKEFGRRTPWCETTLSVLIDAIKESLKL